MKVNIDRARCWLSIGTAVFVLSGCEYSEDVHHLSGEDHDEISIRATLAQLDNVAQPAEDLADLYLDDAVILQPGQVEVRGREAIMELMRAQADGPELEMKHRIDELAWFEDVIIVQGGVTGVARPDDGSGPYPFATQNLIVFKRAPDGRARIWKVIYNSAASPPSASE
ncbi:MAG: hypothetical protein AAGI28_01555 [Pseudomonadota bacterium]